MEIKFRGDYWNRQLGFRIPKGSIVEVLYIRGYRALCRYNGELILTFVRCLEGSQRDGNKD